jgi:hypothetical protein
MRSFDPKPAPQPAAGAGPTPCVRLYLFQRYGQTFPPDEAPGAEREAADPLPRGGEGLERPA